VCVLILYHREEPRRVGADEQVEQLGVERVEREEGARVAVGKFEVEVAQREALEIKYGGDLNQPVELGRAAVAVEQVELEEVTERDVYVRLCAAVS